MPIIDTSYREVHEEQSQKTESEAKPSWYDMIMGLSTTGIIAIFGGLLFLIYLSQPSSVGWYILPILAMLFLLGNKSEMEKIDVTLAQAVNIAYMYVTNQQKIGACESGDVFPHGDRAALRTTREDNKLNKDYYEIGFTIQDEDFLEHKYSVQVDAKLGFVIGMKRRPKGFDGTEIREVITEYIPYKDIPYARGYHPVRVKGGSQVPG